MPGTVTVGCKLHCGMMLQLYGMEDYQEPVMGGGWKTVKRAFPIGDPVKIHGSAKAIGKDIPWDIRSGAGLTHGVDADFFAKWMADNKDSDMVKGGHIFSNAKAESVIAEAKEKKKEKTGLEPLDRNNLPAEFKPVIRNSEAA